MTKHYFSYLALGDSYTIGESVPLHESFPYQTIQLLRNAGLHFNAPEIVAKTGWTSSELAENILHRKLNEQYDFVTLLIGVNNQYRQLPADDFKNDFLFLLKKALHFSGGQAKHVIVLSIPDWGVTPFAIKKDNKKVTAEINLYNKICESVAKENKVHFINITEDSRQVKKDKSLLANDQLHYAGKEYAVWAEKLAAVMKHQIS